ncbi:hypothetical protein D3C71_1196450 [compost metagenome]
MVSPASVTAGSRPRLRVGVPAVLSIPSDCCGNGRVTCALAVVLVASLLAVAVLSIVWSPPPLVSKSAWVVT